jgi:hypothetical protein
MLEEISECKHLEHVVTNKTYIWDISVGTETDHGMDYRHGRIFLFRLGLGPNLPTDGYQGLTLGKKQPESKTNCLHKPLLFPFFILKPEG